MAAKQMRPMQVRVPDSTRNWLKAQARAADRSMNWILNKLLDDLQKKEAQHA